MEQKNYYAIIPANIRYDRELNDKAKLLYAEITSLTNQEGYCWATNGYFADLYGIRPETVSRLIKQLVDKKYLFSKIMYKEGSKKIEERRLYVTNPVNNLKEGREKPIDGSINTYRHSYQEPIDEMVNTPIDENVKDNNKLFNNKTNNNIYRSNGSNAREDFEKLWELYPNKKGKEKAYKAYIKAIENGTSNKQIQTGIISYKNEIEFKRTEEKFIKHGSTWFGNQCWLDTYAQPPKIKQAITNEVMQEEKLSDEEIAELMRGLD